MDNIETFHAALTKEIAEDLSEVEAFERERGWQPYFRNYYANYFKSPRRLRKTVQASIARRQPLVAFCRSLRLANVVPRVLDVGCGFGSDSMFLASQGCAVVGVDPDARKVAIAQRRLGYWSLRLPEVPQPRFQAGYVEDLTTLEPGFDAVFVSECLHHCEPVENVLLRIRDLVAEDGRVFVLESNATNPAVRFLRNARVRDGRRGLLHVVEGRHRLYGNENIRGARQWERLFRDCGFKVSGTYYSRSLLMESTGWEGLERSLCSVPGKSTLSIHVAFELRPERIAPWR